MSSRQDTPPETTPLTGLGWAQRVVRRQLDVLSRLAEVARRLVETAMPQAPSDPTARIPVGVLALERVLRLHGRVAWALRLIDALRARLVADLETLRHGGSLASRLDARAANLETLPETEPQRDGVERAERPERERPESFDRGFSDRAFAKILQRPADEIIALICRELGLPEDWPRLAEEAWEKEEAVTTFSSPARGGGGPAQLVEGAQPPPPAPA